MPESKNPLLTIAEQLKTDVIAALQQQKLDPNGRIAEAMEVQQAEDGSVQLLGPAFLMQIGQPRPTPAPNLHQRIGQWHTEQHIDELQAPPQAPEGQPGLLNTALGNDNLNQRIAEGMEPLAEQYLHQAVDQLGFLSLN